MYSPRETVLHPVAIADRHPMQITVGLRDVDAKRKERRAKADQEGDKYLSKHTIRVILGAGSRCYVIDHHHLARTVHEEGVESVLITVVANPKRLDLDPFWFVFDNRSGMRLYV